MKSWTAQTMQSVLPTARARASVCVGEDTKEMGSTASSFLQMVGADALLYCYYKMFVLQLL